MLITPKWRLALTLAAVAICSPPKVISQEKPDYSALHATLDGRMPGTVDKFPFSALPLETRPMFDSFAWQSFIAAVWPSRPQDHGAPFHPEDPSVMQHGYVGGLQPAFLAWETADTLYTEDGSKPPAWGEGAAADRFCKGAATGAHLFMRSISKFNTEANETDQAFAGPLIDQTGLLTRYEVHFNRVLYDYVRDHGFYNKANWPGPGTPGISFPAGRQGAPGAIMVKAAWRDLSNVPEKYRSRYFTTKALVPLAGSCANTSPPSKCTCGEIPVGLVGLHVTQKLVDFPQFVWSTFEQVDNLGEDPTTPPGMAPAYYNGAKANPASTPGYSYEPSAGDVTKALRKAQSFNGLGAGLKPVNVARLSGIANTPAELGSNKLNERYRALLGGTLWANFELVGSQWSTLPSAGAPNPVQATYKGAPPQDFGCEDGTPPAVGGAAFPACQVSNVTMETFHQLDSCQNCHQGAQRGGADFSWSLFQRAYSGPDHPSTRVVKHTPLP